MAQITFDRFQIGIDLRKGRAVSDANRLIEMENAFVTTGFAAQKRPGLTLIATLETGTRGLFAAFGKLHTFSATSVAHANTLFQNHAVPHSGAGGGVADVPFVDVFNAYLYVAVTYASGATEHHYLDGASPSYIADANCPDSTGCIKMASKIFAIAGDVVRFCKTGAPRDWTTANDAGFLPTGLNARGDRNVNALGAYQSQLVALSRDGAQVWTVDPDPTAMKLADTIENVGTSYPRTVANVAGDLYFLSDYGVRSITTLQWSDNLADVDVGSPVDSVVRSAMQGTTPKSVYYYGTGQYLCALGAQVFVYSLSRSAKIAAWSRYVLPAAVDAFAELEGVLYIRAGDAVWKLDDAALSDEGTTFPVVLQLPYMDFKAPGHLKRITGMDVVMDGEANVSLGWDVRDDTAFTSPVLISGNTRPDGVIPVECTGTEFSLKFESQNAANFRLDAVTIYFDDLGIA